MRLGPLLLLLLGLGVGALGLAMAASNRPSRYEAGMYSHPDPDIRRELVGALSWRQRLHIWGIVFAASGLFAVVLAFALLARGLD